MGAKDYPGAEGRGLARRHPAVTPPSSTAAIRGYDAVTGARGEPGCRDAYLAMRQGIPARNAFHHDLLSRGRGATGGLLLDIGRGHYPPSPPVREACAGGLFPVASDSCVGELRDPPTRPGFSRTSGRSSLSGNAPACSWHWVSD